MSAISYSALFLDIFKLNFLANDFSEMCYFNTFNRANEATNDLKIKPYLIVPSPLEIQFEKLTRTQTLTKELL